MTRAMLRNDRGSIAIISAFSAGLGCLIAAIAIDVGSVALDARRLQGAADLAAMAAGANLDNALATAQANAVANLPRSGLQTAIELGTYVGNPAVAPVQRFTPQPSPSSPTAINAVRVTLHTETPIYFGSLILGKRSVTISRSAVAAVEQQPMAMFSIGSRLASLDGGLANKVLSGLTGSSVSLSVMDYRSLADLKVNLLTFSDALGTELGVTAGDYDGLLDRTINVGRALKVLEGLAGDSGDSALSKLASSAVGIDLRLGDLIGVEADAGRGIAGGLDATVSALDLATAMIEIGGGERQIALDLGVNAGLAALKASLAIGERPNNSAWLTVTSKGTPIIRTAQARLYVKATTSQQLAGLAQVKLPILIELAASEARLNAITCVPGRTVTLGVRPGLAKASIGEIKEAKLANFKQPLTVDPATLVSVLGLVTVTAKAEIEASDQAFTPVTFSNADITAQTLKSVQARGLVNGIVVSLLKRMDVDVQVIGLGLGLGGLVQALGVLLTPLGPVLDAVINPLLDVLGLKFGEADVRVLDATCDQGQPALVG